MRIIDPRYEIFDEIDGAELLKKIELCGRTCYKSEERITKDSAENFVRGIIKSKHDSVLEHASLTVKFIVDRAIANEIVRHRISSYSQESTRYCNYKKHGGITVIRPSHLQEDDEHFEEWANYCASCEDMYMELLKKGHTPEQARNVLPHNLKTELVVTMNLRSWEYFLKLRVSVAANSIMVYIARPLLEELKKEIPVIFEDIM